MTTSGISQAGMKVLAYFLREPFLEIELRLFLSANNRL